MARWQTIPEIGRDDVSPAVLDAHDTGLILLDGNYRVVEWNVWLACASGIASEVAVGKSLDELFPLSQLNWLTSAVASTLKSGTSALLTHSLHPRLFPLKTRAGHVLIHDVTVSAVGRNPVYCLIQIFNVTIAAERERMLREHQNARFYAVIDSAPDVILTLDADDTIQLANPAAARQFGYAPRQCQTLSGRQHPMVCSIGTMTASTNSRE